MSEMVEVTVEHPLPHAGGCSARLTHKMPATYAVYTERAERGWKTILTSIEASL